MATIDDALTETINALQAYHASVTGVASAPALDSYPTVLDTAALPCVLTIPAESQFWIKGGRANVIDPQGLRVVCFLEPLGINDIPVRMQEAVLLLQRLRNVYINPAKVPVINPSVTYPFQVTLESSEERTHRDSGISPNLSFNGKPYYGFEITLSARILYVR